LISDEWQTVVHILDQHAAAIGEDDDARAERVLHQLEVRPRRVSHLAEPGKWKLLRRLVEHELSLHFVHVGAQRGPNHTRGHGVDPHRRQLDS